MLPDHRVEGDHVIFPHSQGDVVVSLNASLAASEFLEVGVDLFPKDRLYLSVAEPAQGLYVWSAQSEELAPCYGLAVRPAADEFLGMWVGSLPEDAQLALLADSWGPNLDGRGADDEVVWPAYSAHALYEDEMPMLGTLADAMVDLVYVAEAFVHARDIHAHVPRLLAASLLPTVTRFVPGGDLHHRWLSYVQSLKLEPIEAFGLVEPLLTDHEFAAAAALADEWHGTYAELAVAVRLLDQ